MPLLQASQDTPDGAFNATITRAPDGALITEFSLNGRPTAPTPVLREWLRRVLSHEESALRRAAGDS